MALSKNLRRFAITVICVTLIGGQSVFAAQEVVTDEEIGTVQAVVGAAKSITVGTVNCDVLNVRADSSTDAAILGKLYFGETIQLTDSKDGWYYMDCSAGKGWVSGEYISNVQTMTEQEYQKKQSEASDIGKQVAAYSKQFLGKPYARGGNGPNSFDCSGFVRYVYGAYGVLSRIPQRASQRWDKQCPCPTSSRAISCALPLAEAVCPMWVFMWATDS